MISIIICNRRPNLLTEIHENIADTIGCDFELIAVDNSNNEYTIFTAYNEGITRAKGDIVCFMHDDVRCVSKDWGQIVESYFRADAKLGCVGVVGTHLMPDTPCGWYHPMVCSGGCKQWHKDEYHVMVNKNHMQDKGTIEVVAVDGMFFCIRKDLFDKNLIRFDDTTFSNFHCYDIDICLQIRKCGYKVIVSDEFLVQHSSYGKYNDIWWQETQKLHAKWHDSLPQVAGVDLDVREVNARTEMVQQVMVWLTGYAQLDKDYHTVLNSYAYKIGRKIMTIPGFLRHGKRS